MLSARAGGRATERWARGAAAALCLLALAPAAAAEPAYPPLFGFRELHSKTLTLFPKWRGVVSRYQGELEDCSSAQCNRAYWQGFIESQRGRPLMDQITAVHREMNKKRYIIDPVNWGVPDYWATPFQFLRKHGDCEDYAIAKFMALRDLGVPNEAMRIVVLQDLNLRLAHAILVVYVEGTAYVLDNQIRSVVPADSIRHYKPVYSINEDGWWLHRPAG